MNILLLVLHILGSLCIDCCFNNNIFLFITIKPFMYVYIFVLIITFFLFISIKSFRLIFYVDFIYLYYLLGYFYFLFLNNNSLKSFRSFFLNNNIFLFINIKFLG